MARPLGPKMQLALEYVGTHPGVTKREALDAAGHYCRPYGGAPDPVDRLFARGLLYNLGRSNRHRWYVWQDHELRNNDRPSGVWAPAAHP